MCEICEKLIACPVGEKRKALILEDKAKTEMVLDRYPDRANVFIHTECTDIDGHWYNDSVKIKYCPFCGKELK